MSYVPENNIQSWMVITKTVNKFLKPLKNNVTTVVTRNKSRVYRPREKVDDPLVEINGRL